MQNFIDYPPESVDQSCKSISAACAYPSGHDLGCVCELCFKWISGSASLAVIREASYAEVCADMWSTALSDREHLTI